MGQRFHLCLHLAGFRVCRLHDRHPACYLVGWRVTRTAHKRFVLDALEQALLSAPADPLWRPDTPQRPRQPVRSNTPSASPRPGLSLPSAASAIATTVPSSEPQPPFRRRKGSGTCDRRSAYPRQNLTTRVGSPPPGTLVGPPILSKSLHLIARPTIGPD